MVRPDSQLTPEERAFLQSLWQQPVAEDEDRDYLCRLMPEGELAAFWQWFARERLEIVVHRGRCRYQFPLRVVGDAHQPLHFQVGIPEIHDEQARPRALRVAPPQEEVCLRSGRATQPGCTPVLDISASGIAVPAGALGGEGRRGGPRHLELLLPGEAPMPLQARTLAGRRRPRRLVINLDRQDQRLQTALRRYIFRAHLRDASPAEACEGGGELG
ncbi:PilZ domain-containing protein [Alkalilimnicola ehrlichii]|nr:hypothetical protein [Alkalilimnicola ehrlichii]